MADDNGLRADARENRDRILDVARGALAADPSASLNSIAKAAGVGPGTLYRHFPSREALVLGIYRQEIDAMVALAPVLLAEHPPLRAFRLWGEIHAGADAEDFLTLLGLLWRIPPDPAGEARGKRLVALAFRGLGAKEVGR